MSKSETISKGVIKPTSPNLVYTIITNSNEGLSLLKGVFQAKNKDGYDVQYNGALYGGGLSPLSDSDIAAKFVTRWGNRGNDPSKTEAMACYVINSKEGNTLGCVNIGTSGTVIDPITKKPMYEFGVLPNDSVPFEAQAEAYNAVLVKYPTANKGTMVSSKFIIGTISAPSHIEKVAAPKFIERNNITDEAARKHIQEELHHELDTKAKALEASGLTKLTVPPSGNLAEKVLGAMCASSRFTIDEDSKTILEEGRPVLGYFSVIDSDTQLSGDIGASSSSSD